MKPVYLVNLPGPGFEKEVIQEIMNWIPLHVRGEWNIISSIDGDLIYLRSKIQPRCIWTFTEQSDAILFKLTWGGEQ